MRSEALIAVVLGCAVFLSTHHMALSTKTTTELLSSCSECRDFVPALLDVTGKHGLSASLTKDDEKNVCSAIGARHEKACNMVAQAYGLKNVDILAAASPDLLCAAVSQCEKQATKLGYFGEATSSDVLVSSTGLNANLDLTAGLGTDAAGDAADLSESALDTAKNPLETLRKMMQQRQVMQMQMQQNQMMQMQLMRMRLMSIMSSNREMKNRMNHMRRHIPGNCDCCQACPPPPEFAPVR